MASKSAPARKAPPTPVRKPAPALQPARTAPPPKPAAALPPSAAAAPAAAADKPKRTRTRTRSAPMERAVKFVRLADKNIRRALRLVDNWHGEATDDQKKLNAAVLAELKASAPHLEAAFLAVGLLGNSGFRPTEARGRAVTEPPEPGERVQVKAKYFIPTLHGLANDFEVVSSIRVNRPAQGAAPATTTLQVRIRPTGDLKAAQFVLPWSQLERIDEGEQEDEEGEKEEVEQEDTEAGDGDEGESDSEGGEPELDFEPGT